MDWARLEHIMKHISEPTKDALISLAHKVPYTEKALLMLLENGVIDMNEYIYNLEVCNDA